MNILHYGNILLHPYFFPLFPRKWGFLEERCFGVCDEIKEEAMKKFDDF